jgi:3-hydroxyacyl-[acyl-carrier-protein] dehydratase
MESRAGASESEIRNRIQVILRKDLKLGPDIAIPDDMPFFGSNIDLDSLDMLLLVTSIEKEFGFKVPSEAVGKEVFQNVGALVQYIQRQGATAGGPDYLSRLPHADPFRFVSKVCSVKEGESAEGIWSVNGSEPFLAGHFPGNPIVPGILIAEALAQISGLAGPPAGSGGKLAHVDIRFVQAVVPPVEITLRAKFSRAMGALQQFEVSALVKEQVVAHGSLALHRPAAGGEPA